MAAHILSRRRKALSPGCGAYCSPAAAEIKPVRKAGDKGGLQSHRISVVATDNILKAPLDALTHAGVLMDDEQFDEINIVRGQPVSGGRLGVKIYPIMHEEQVKNETEDLPKYYSPKIPGLTDASASTSKDALSITDVMPRRA